MLVLAGNSIAKNFTNVTSSFTDLPFDEGVIFNTLFLKDENMVVAVSSKIFRTIEALFTEKKVILAGRK